MPHALASACKQTYENLEILVADNASTDETSRVVQGLADARIRYHRHPSNVGAAKNLSFCIDDARGEYVLLLMDDDLIDDDFVTACIEAASTKPDAGLIRTGTRVLNGEGLLMYESRNQVAGLDFTDFVLAWLEGRTAPFLCSTLFRTTPLREIGMRSRHCLWDDVIAELKLAARFGRVDIQAVKATYCLHHGELTVGADIQDWLEDSEELLELVCNLAPQDAARLRPRLKSFLASFNYRNALRLRKPWTRRIAACGAVGKTFGAYPDPSLILREVLQQTPWFETLRASKRWVTARLPR